MVNAVKICVDELSPIAVYIAQEINTNANGVDTKRMKQLNAFSSQACINEFIRGSFWRRLFGAIPPQQCLDIKISSAQAALLMFTAKVMQGADWDHKPKVAAKFKSRVSGNRSYHAFDDTVFFYDIWSNIHYGYVGRAAGFSESVLLDGAGLEQIGTDFMRGRWPARSNAVKGLRAYDDESDREAISLGVTLFSDFPKHVSARSVVDRVLTAPGLTKKPVL